MRDLSIRPPEEDNPYRFKVEPKDPVVDDREAVSCGEWLNLKPLSELEWSEL